jgi:two-component system phosphate regulon response regulator PhoB
MLEIPVLEVRAAVNVGRSHHVVVVEDDPEQQSLVRDALEEEGFRVTALGEGRPLLSMIASHHPDLVILDLVLPDVPGLELLRALQQHGRIPTIVVSGRGAETDRVVGLELGADDYVAKPYSPRELIARVHAVLRRVDGPGEHAVLEYPGLVIDVAAREVLVAGRTVELTSLEFDLFAFLAANPRQVFSREVLLDRVWGSSSEWQTTATVSEHIHRLRRKIEADPARPRLIETLRGAGYRFRPPVVEGGDALGPEENPDPRTGEPV